MIKIDTKQLIYLANELKEVHRAALPNAARSTLNDIAFDVKKNTLYQSVTKNFDYLRQPNLFKAYSGVMKATGWDVQKMESTVGMMPSMASGKAEKTIQRLQAQEEGGTLDSSFIASDEARTGGVKKGKVSKSKWKGNLTKVASVPFGEKQKLIREVTGSQISKGGKGKGVAILYGNVLYEIQGFKRLRKTNSIKLSLKKLYTYKKSRTVNIKATHFVKEAGLVSIQKLPTFFQQNAEKQLSKFAK